MKGAAATPAAGPCVHLSEYNEGSLFFMLRPILATWLVVGGGAQTLLGWGAQGHRIAARIAEGYLTQHARGQVRAILDGDQDFVLCSTWADEVRPQRGKTAPWHYINIPLTAKRSAGFAQFCNGGECLPKVIQASISKLKDPRVTGRERAEALKFLVHFVADLHQPLHAGDNRDRGGNDTKVVYFGKSTNLHRIWDTDILVRMRSDEQAATKVVMAELTGARERKWRSGTLDDWLWESQNAARAVVYKNLPKGSEPALDFRYQREAEKVVRTQLAKSGVRLARLLNEIWP